MVINNFQRYQIKSETSKHDRAATLYFCVEALDVIIEVSSRVSLQKYGYRILILIRYLPFYKTKNMLC